MQAPVGGYIHLAADKLLHFATEPDEGKSLLSWHVLHQEIQIAIRACLVPREGAEDTDVPDAIAFA
jgi:hypothetical protein